MRGPLLVLLALAASGCNLLFPPDEEETDSDGVPGEPGGDVFLAVGDQGAVLSSPDGVTWTVRTSGTNVALYDVAYSGARYVAVGQAGKIVASDDGITWTGASSPSSRDLRSVTWHLDRFYAVGGDYSAGAETLESLDGITWTRPEIPVVQHVLTDLASDGLNLVATGTFQPDLQTFGLFTWTGGSTGWQQQIDGSVTGTSFDGLASGIPAFAMIGNAVAATSTNGTVWTSTPIIAVPPMHGLTYSQFGWVAVGDGGGVLTSPDAVAWTATTTPATTALRAVTTSGALLVAVGAAGTLLSSADGVNWTLQISDLEVDLHGVTHTRE